MFSVRIVSSLIFSCFSFSNLSKLSLANFNSSLVGIFKYPINLIIDGINSFISGLNNIKIPDWVPAVGGKGINIPKIPRLAQGGVVDKPTIAMIGEAGKEAIIPMESNLGALEKLSTMIGDKICWNGQPIQLVVKIGDDTILDRFIEGINNKNFETNGGVFNIWFITET